MRHPDTGRGQVYSSLQKALEAKGAFTKEIDELVTLLNNLVDERKRLSVVEQSLGRSVHDDEDDDGGGASSLTARLLRSHASQTHAARLTQVNAMIADVESELHRLTGNIDHIPSRSSRVRLSSPAGAHAAASRDGSPSKRDGLGGMLLPYPTVLTALSMAISHIPPSPTPAAAVCALGATDVALQLAAVSFFGSVCVGYQCSKAQQKVALSRVRLFRAHALGATREVVKGSVDVALAIPRDGVDER